MSLLDELRKKLRPNTDASKELDIMEKELQSQLEALRKERDRRANYAFNVGIKVNAERLADMAGDEVLTPAKVKEMLTTVVNEWLAESPFGPMIDVTFGSVNAANSPSGTISTASQYAAGLGGSLAQSQFNIAMANAQAQVQALAQTSASNSFPGWPNGPGV